MDQLTYAKFYAAMKHEGQKYGVLPYTHHLESVERVLRQYGPIPSMITDNGEVLVPWDDPATSEEMYVAAWLHDVVEDTDAKVRDIEELFGERVARLVASVTSQEGTSRKVRNALTYPGIRFSGPYSVRLKLADRLANVMNGGGSVAMYEKEHEDFKRVLYTPGENEDLWEAIDSAFSDRKKKSHEEKTSE